MRRTLLLLLITLSLAACRSGSVPQLIVTTDVEISGLEVRQTDFSVDHPITISVSLLSTQPLDSVDVAVGLMQQVSTDATDEVKAAALSCALGYVRVEKLEANEAATGSNEFIVNQDCPTANSASALNVLGQTSGDTEVSYNIWAFIDPDDQITETGEGAEDNNAVVFNEAEKNNPTNQKCTSDSASESGCIHDIPIKPNPGLDLSVSSFELESKYLILHSAADHPDVTPGGNEHNFPHVRADVGVRLDGAPTATTNGLPSDTELVFDICPDSGDGQNCTGGDWMPLTISSNTNEPDGHDRVETISQLSSGHNRFISDSLYLEGDTLTAVKTGGTWADYDTFNVRACINTARAAEPGFGLAAFSPIPESDPSGGDASSDNCKFQTVIVAIPITPITPPLGPSSVSLSRSDGHNWGSSDKIGITANFGTANKLDFQGAHWNSDASVKLEGWINATLLDLSAAANALVSIVDSNMDVAVRGFGVTLFHYTKKIPEFHYDKTWDITKQICATFSYGIYILSLDIDVCATGSLGFEAGVALVAREGAGSGVFANSAKVGSLEPIFRPFLNFDGSATGEVNAEVARAGIEADIAILDQSLPLTGYLRWGFNNASEMVIEANVNLQATLTTLKGKLFVFADIREVKWCHKWHIPYPCGTRWKREASKTIVSWKGKTLDYTLLNRTKDITLNQ